MTKACVLGQNASVMTCLHLWPLASPNPWGSDDSVSQHWSHPYGSRIRLGPPFITGFSDCSSGLAELPEGASQKTVSQCEAKMGHIVLPLESWGLGVSFYVSLRKIGLRISQCRAPQSSRKPLLL